MTQAASIQDMREALQNDGYVVLPGFFSQAELQRMRDIVGRFFGGGRGVIYNLGKTQPNAAIECAELSWLFADPKVTGLFKQLLGNHGAMFTGHCDLHDSIVSNWHRDTGGPGHPYFEDPCFAPDCRVYKMAIYLQDHADGNGLTVHPGSHLSDEPPQGPAAPLKTAAGDAIVFDVRVSHRGRRPNAAERLLTRAGRVTSRLGGSSAGQPTWTYLARKAMDQLGGVPPKLSIFFTYGAQNPLTEQFARANMARQLDQYASGGGIYPADLTDKLRQSDVAVYEPENA